jgi:tetratricopeptide (TPR) repeat protein
MKSRFLAVLTGIVMLACFANAQAPSVQLKITEKSGFLGMGAARIVNIELSNQSRQQPLTSTNVNGGQYLYFLVSPAEDWLLDADFVTENLSKVFIYQNQQKISVAWKSELIIAGNNSILLGFGKTLRLDQSFLLQCSIGETTSQVEMKVPQEYWPGYQQVVSLCKQADSAFTLKQYKTAITGYEQVLATEAYQIFPQYNEIKDKRTQCYDGYYNESWAGFQAVVTNTQFDLKQKIAHINGITPLFKFVIDSLPRAAWNIGSLDPAVAPIVEHSRAALTQTTGVRDSLQHAFDDQNIHWIIDGSSTGKNGYLYSYMIETLASAFSSLNFSDTAAIELKVRIPDDLQARLVKYTMVESYETFLRVCNERYQSHVPVFPIDFLPNLKRDSISFPLPYYAMLKAVNDYYYNNFASAKEEILKVFRTCYEPELNLRFDLLRQTIVNHEQGVSPDVIKMLDEAAQLGAKRDATGALDKYRQITLVAPNFAYGFYALGKYYLSTSDQIRATYSFQRAYQLDTLFLTAYRECYMQYLKQGNYKEMINVLTTAVSKGNDFWEINYNLGVAYLGDADPARAIQSFEHALALNPRSYKTNIQLGLAHQSVKNYQKAREYFNNAIGLDPTRNEAVDYLTKLNDLQRQGK